MSSALSPQATNLILIFKNALEAKDVQDHFKHGKPVIYDVRDYPRLLVPKIIEAFRELKEEPTFLDITVAAPAENTMDYPVEVWPQIYDSYLPCHTCTTIDISPNWRVESYMIEKFHVTSKHFDKQLTVELHFPLRHSRIVREDMPERPPTAPKIEKDGLYKVVIRMVDGLCSGPKQAVTRNSTSVLLLPEFASEVYGFVDRVYVGTSLVANRGLNKLIFKLRHRLPVHHLMCEFAETGIWPRTGVYRLILHHFRRDLDHSDVRHFKIPSTAGFRSTAANCALMLRYLSNGHVVDFKAPCAKPRFTFKLLAAMVDRNFSVGRLRVRAPNGPLTDYRSLKAVFGGEFRLGALNLYIREECLARLIKTTDFLRMPTLQGLAQLKLVLGPSVQDRAWPDKSWTRRQRAIVSSPLWIAGIYLLRQLERFEVDYEPYDRHRHLETIAHKLVQVCEKFERGEISETVDHFTFATECRMDFPFKDANKTASAVKYDYRRWDVYRFRNASIDEWLTACVRLDGWAVLHIVKGQAYPDASFGRL